MTSRGRGRATNASKRGCTRGRRALVNGAVPEEVEAQTRRPDLVVCEPRPVRHLVPAEVELGAEREVTADASVVGQPRHEGRRGRRADVWTELLVQGDAAKPE